MHERRRSRRDKIRQDASYSRISGCATISSVATINNISLDGLCVTLSRIVEKGDEISIDLSLPHQEKLSVRAKVVWAKQSLESNGSRICGVKFLSVSSMPLLMSYVAYSKKVSGAP